MKVLKKVFATVYFGVLSSFCMAQTGKEWEMKQVSIQTRWAKEVNPNNVLPEYPRPQMVRNQWENLNGLWDYTITSKDSEKLPDKFNGKILVPFPIESALSGVKKALQPEQCLWYKRTFYKKNLPKNKKTLLHFGAVDWYSTIYVNGKKMGSHTGGYQNFTFDITEELKTGNNELLISVLDPTDQGTNPHGNQTLKPQNLSYTASSGIWQTVWLEEVPISYISDVTITPLVDDSSLNILVNYTGKKKNYDIEVISSDGSFTKGKPGSKLSIPIKNAHLWSPNDPFLYNLNIRLLSAGKIIDTVGSYFGMRKIEIKKDPKGIERIFLNNNYFYQLGILDQGYWPEGLYTAPTDSALLFDLMATSDMGFNAIRKHLKIEPARWYYHADRMGVLVWQDLIPCAGTTGEARDQFEIENKEVINQLHNYPSIVVFILFNEGVGRYDQRRLTEWLKGEEPSRLIDGNSGENYDKKSSKKSDEKWIASDLTDSHEYPGPGIPDYLPGKARVLGKWGSVRFEVQNHEWNSENGLNTIQSTKSRYYNQYMFMLKHLKLFEEEGISASFFSELFDVEKDEDGIMSYDREIIKIPMKKMREINSIMVPYMKSSTKALENIKFSEGDTSDVDVSYSVLFQMYVNGKKDSSFLYNLSQAAKKANDIINSEIIANDYIVRLKKPFTKDNLTFILQNTNTPRDPGFKLVFENIDKVNEVIGINSAERKLLSIIYKEELERYVSDLNSNIEWDKLETIIKKKYNKLGEEVLLRAKAITYYKKNQYQHFIEYYSQYVQKYPKRIDAIELNDFAWKIFQNTEDTRSIKQAIQWVLVSLQKEKAFYTMDTYANLLYKLGKKEEAIQMEESAIKATELDEYKSLYKKNLNKMINGASISSKEE